MMENSHSGLILNGDVRDDRVREDYPKTYVVRGTKLFSNVYTLYWFILDHVNDLQCIKLSIKINYS
jgi:hypothetical protein